MYRLLAIYDVSLERQAQFQHPPRPVPQLRADAPNQLRSWDITKLKSPRKYVHFYLYVILDIFSRYFFGRLDDRRTGVGRVGNFDNRKVESDPLMGFQSVFSGRMITKK